MELRKIAEHVGGEIVGDGSIEITGVAGLKEAKSGDITFFANPRYETHLRSTDASAIILPQNGVPVGEGKTLVLHPNPYVAFLRVIELFAPRDYEGTPGIHPTAVVGKNVKLGESITLGPNVVIDDDALAHLVDVANGDARGVLNALELAVETTPPQASDRAIHITLE